MEAFRSPLSLPPAATSGLPSQVSEQSRTTRQGGPEQVPGAGSSDAGNLLFLSGHLWSREPAFSSAGFELLNRLFYTGVYSLPLG